MKLNHKTAEELIRERERFTEAFRYESDRGLVLVGGAFLDLTLENLLRARFLSRLKDRSKLIEPLFGGYGPLSTFSAKIRISYAIDLLQDWMASDLDVIRSIRNEFAHNLELTTFHNPKISLMIGKLIYYDKTGKILKAQGITRKVKVPPELVYRNKFNSVCGVIGALLQAKIVVLHSDAPEAMKREFLLNPDL